MLLLTGWVLVLAGAAVHATRYPRWAWQPTVIVATFAPAAPAASATGTLLIGLAGRPFQAAAALALTITITLIQAGPFLPLAGGRRRSPFVPATLTVLTHNLWRGRGDADALLRACRAANADVICLQEVTASSVAALRSAGIDGLYPHSALAPAPDWNGAAIWSRLPLRDVAVSTRGTLLRVEAVVMLGDEPAAGDPALISVHVHAPWPGPAAPWVDQLAELKADVSSRPRPVIVAGDFNATHDHAVFRDLLDGTCSDAAAQAGAGWRPTYPGHLRLPPFAVIDHVLARGLRAVDARTVVVPGSDHRAVVARLRVADPADGG